MHIHSLPISLFRTASKMDFLYRFFVVRFQELQNLPKYVLTVGLDSRYTKNAHEWEGIMQVE
jgi:hypothetical protein